MQPGHQAEIAARTGRDSRDLRARAAALIGDGRLEDAAALLAEGRRTFPDDVEIRLDQASLAEAATDWNGAVELLEEVIDRFPGTRSAYGRAGALHRRLDRDGEAEAILVEGICRFPDDLDILSEYIAIAEARQDWRQAARRARLLCERFPSHGTAHARLAGVLRRMNRTEDAERALLRGQEQVPHDPHLPIEHAELAVERQDWDEAARRFAMARERLPGTWWPFRREADMLKRAGRTGEAETILLDGQRLFPHELDLFLDHAELAAGAGDWAEALRRFAVVHERFPDFSWSIKRTADILKAAGRTDEAERALRDGQDRFPGDRDLALEHAEIAFGRQDWPEALRRFGIARDRFPDFWWPWKRIADVLRADGRNNEAEAALLDGQERFPGESCLFIDHADLASERRDWAETLRRSEIVRNQFPDIWWPYRRIAGIFFELDRIEDAERILLKGQELFPNEPAMFFDYAELAQRTGRVEDAVERFQAVHGRFPENYWGYFLLARAFMALGRLGEAESKLIQMMRVFPDASGVVVELVHLTGRIAAEARQISLPALADMVIAHIQKDGETIDLLGAQAHLTQLDGNYPGYMRQLIHIAEHYPDARDVRARMAAVREILLGSGGTVPGEAADKPIEPGNVPKTPQELIGHFESLGGGGPDGSTMLGCEFGFLQRELGIEPLSLLRWTGVNLQNVTRLLENDFRGVGDPETTVLTSVDKYYDWHVVDTTYDLRCDHSHLDRLTVPKEQAQTMMCHRSTFLARKLREDLEDGGKIFVYRYAGRLEDEADMLALARAVNGYGRNMLLFVCRADAHHAPLTVRQVHPGLVVGHIDWFAIDRHGYPVNIDGWMALCEAAYRLWRPQQAAV